MQLKLVELNDSNEDFYKKCWVAAMKHHTPYAEKCGLIDKVCAYAIEQQALKDIPADEKCFIIVSNDKQVGFVVYNEDVHWYQEPTRKISFLYIIPEERGKGIASKILSDLHEGGFVVLECWYGLPASKLYQKLGFVNLYQGLIWK